MNYTQSTAMLDIIPIVLSLFTVTIWARLYDHWGLPKYRVINGGFWTIRMILTAAAVVCTQYLLDMPHGYALVVGIFVFAQVLNGIAQGGGGIAWNLGHLHFARPEEAELYMGLHATLTGIRGWLGFVGAPLYLWGGWGVFAVAAVMSLVGFVLYFHGMTTRFGLGGRDGQEAGDRLQAAGDSRRQADKVKRRTGKGSGQGDLSDLLLGGQRLRVFGGKGVGLEISRRRLLEFRRVCRMQ